ncbi:hypothetical protein [Marinagarivorans algicola]|uniref:hypothetical protein n=1 Tax=Marinagarivorans algicola TaxID=1513270 RepID=UPI003736AF28
MSEIIELQDLTKTLAKPYIVTRSKLGTTTQLIEEQFVCSPTELKRLFDSIGEKILSFNPSKAGFQYLVSFTDGMHHENSSLDSLKERLEGSEKKTEKLILNWHIGHELDGIENEMTITVRISNPMNPLVMLQAALSDDHSDIDRLSFNDGAVSVAVNGATQNSAEEIFSIVQKWASACPKPESITGVNETIYKHHEKLSFLNYWVFPSLFIAVAFVFLKGLDQLSVQAYGFLAFGVFMLIRSAAQNVNRRLEWWCRISRKFSMFMITGGDSNQQNKIAARSKNGTIKAVASALLSFFINIAAGIALIYLTNS